jgi:branched-chain amino acid transport system ATP-binding protein
MTVAENIRKPKEEVGGPCLKIKGLSKRFGRFQAVNNIDLEVAYGERRAIIGANGAGKTTLFNLIAGEFPPTSGRVLFAGHNVTNKRPYQRAYLGMARTYQITNLFPSLSVLYNLLLGVQALEKTKYVTYRPLTSYKKNYDKARELLERIGLSEKQDVLLENLPYGEQRLIELALSLVGNPKLLLLDEPTSGLPPGESQELTKVLMGLDSKTTIIIVEHDMEVAFSVADNVTVMHQGEILTEGTIAEIKMNPEVQRTYLGEEE